MALSLPGNPDLERLRRDARRLQRGVRSADPRALALVARHHPEGLPGRDGVVLAVRRAAGRGARLRLRELAAAARLPRGGRGPWSRPGRRSTRSRPMESDHDAESASVATALACLTYTDRDEPARWARAAELLAARPEARGARRLRGRGRRRRRGPARPPRRRPRRGDATAGRSGGRRCSTSSTRGCRRCDAVASRRRPARRRRRPRQRLPLAGAARRAFTALTGVFGEGEAGTAPPAPAPAVARPRRAAARARRRPERPAGALQPDVQPRRQPPRAAPRARARAAGLRGLGPTHRRARRDDRRDAHPSGRVGARPRVRRPARAPRRARPADPDGDRRRRPRDGGTSPGSRAPASRGCHS